MTLVYKICPRLMWQQAEEQGAFVGAPVDVADGFIHLSTSAQVAETARRHFAGQADLMLVAIDAAALGPLLRYEPSRGGNLFPHLYGPLPTSSARRIVPLPIGPDGLHVLPPEIAGPAPGPGFDPAAAGWERFETDSFIGLVGPVWRSPAGEEPVRYGLVAEGRHLNRGGIMHGGMVMTFADQALGLAAWAVNGERPQVTVHLDTHFISGVKEGEFVEALCRVVRKTRMLLFMAAELSVGARTVATSSGVWKMRDERSG